MDRCTRLTIKNGEIESIAGRVMGGPSSNSLARLSQSTAAAGGISTVNTGNAAKSCYRGPGTREMIVECLVPGSSEASLKTISPEKRASMEESSRGTFFRIPAAMPTYRY